MRTLKAFIAKRAMWSNKICKAYLGSVYFIFALDKHGRMVDGVCCIAEENGRRYISESKILSTCTTANAGTDTEWHWKTKVPAEVGRQVGTTWMRKLTIAGYVGTFNSWKCVAVYTAEERRNGDSVECKGRLKMLATVQRRGLRIHVKNVLYP